MLTLLRLRPTTVALVGYGRPAGTVDEVEGYADNTYGDSFADVYDDWYGTVSDIEATTAAVAVLAAHRPDLPVLELGIGTGRLALPLAAAGIDVVGIDASRAMLDVLERKAPATGVRWLQGDMVDDLPPGPFSVVFVAYNTLFNLRTALRQQQCFAAVAERLAPGGAFVVEAFVPSTTEDVRDAISIRSLTAGRVVLSVSRSDPSTQTADGQYIDITEAGGVRLRPWSVHWSTPAQLDAMASTVGLHLAERWADFAQAPFTPSSERHVSVWRTAAHPTV